MKTLQAIGHIWLHVLTAIGALAVVIIAAPLMWLMRDEPARNVHGELLVPDDDDAGEDVDEDVA